MNEELTRRKLRTMVNHNKADGFERRLEVSRSRERCFPTRETYIHSPRISSFTSWKTSSMRSTSRGKLQNVRCMSPGSAV